MPKKKKRYLYKFAVKRSNPADQLFYKSRNVYIYMEIGLFEVYLFLLMESCDENEQSVFVNSAVCNI